MCVTIRALACRLRVFSPLLFSSMPLSQALETPQAQREPVWRDVLLSISLFSFQVMQQDTCQQRHVSFYITTTRLFFTLAQMQVYTQQGVHVILLVSELSNIYGTDR